MPDHILLIIADDHGQWALGSYGNREIRTPALDYLAQSGVQMDNAFTPTPVCSPARASLLTGRLASQHGIHDYLSSNDPEIDNRNWLGAEITLPAVLAEAGYQTALAGKWHLGRDEQVHPDFDTWFSLSGDYPVQHGGKIRYSDQGSLTTIAGYQTDVITERALGFLRNRDQQRSFFLQVGYTATHHPWQDHPERLVSAYRQCAFSDIPDDAMYPFGQQNLESTFPTRHNQQEARAQYYAAVSHIDEGVGRLLDELEALGLREETLVVYTSDHGLNCGHHGIWGKGNGTLPLNMVEESIRVPLLINQPRRLLPAQRRREFVDHLDLFQTVADYAGIPLPDRGRDYYPGRSFLPILDNSAALPDWRNVQFGEYGNLRMIRTERFKLVRRYPEGPCELFDLRHDPRETVNLFDDAACAALIDRLTEEIEMHFSRYQDARNSGLNVQWLPRHNDTEAWRLGGSR